MALERSGNQWLLRLYSIIDGNLGAITGISWLVLLVLPVTTVCSGFILLLQQQTQKGLLLLKFTGLALLQLIIGCLVIVNALDID